MRTTFVCAGLSLGVLVPTVPGTAQTSGEQATRAATRAQATRVEKASDEERAGRIRVLARQPPTEFRYEQVDPGQFKAALEGAEALYQLMAAAPSRDRGDQRTLEGVLSMTDVVYQTSVEQGVVDRRNLELARLAEKQLTLAYWDGIGHRYPKRSFEVRQSAYVLQDRVHRMADAVDTGEAASDWTAAGKGRARELLASGQAASSQLTESTATASAKQVQALAESVDRLSQRVLTGRLPIGEARTLALLDGAVQDVHQQLVAYSLVLEAPIEVTVRTKLEGEESPGHIVRYELPIDFELEEFQNYRFDSVTSPSNHQLGPFHYYLWTEKGGVRTSEPQLINLGEPLKPRRDLDLVLLSPPP